MNVMLIFLITLSNIIFILTNLQKSFKMMFLNTLKLKCSIGIAPNKFMAKMASDMKKPMGITILNKI